MKVGKTSFSRGSSDRSAPMCVGLRRHRGLREQLRGGMYKPNGGALAGLLGSSARHQLKRANAKLSIVKKAAEVRFNIIVKDISVEGRNGINEDCGSFHNCNSYISLTISGKIVDGPVELCTVCFAILQHVQCKVIICEEASGMGPKLQHLKTSS